EPTALPIQILRRYNRRLGIKPLLEMFCLWSRGRAHGGSDRMAMLAKWRDALWNDPLLTVAITAAVVALAFTPPASAVLGRVQWFKAGRGRTMQRPSFASIVVAMMLVMGIPAIFLALVVKSQYFDKNRYEFDPNKTWSVLEQGRGLRDVKEADLAVRREMD